METFFVVNNSVYLVGDYQMLTRLVGPQEFFGFEQSGNKITLFNKHNTKVIKDNVLTFNDIPSWTLSSDYTGGNHPLAGEFIALTHDPDNTYYVTMSGELRSKRLQPFTSYYLVNYSTWRNLTWVKIKFTLKQKESLIRISTKPVKEQSRCQVTKSFPKHWGQEPSLQKRDFVAFPDGYGCGSSTKKNWIISNLKQDQAQLSGRRRAPPILPEEEVPSKQPQIEKPTSVKPKPVLKPPSVKLGRKVPEAVMEPSAEPPQRQPEPQFTPSTPVHAMYSQKSQKPGSSNSGTIAIIGKILLAITIGIVIGLCLHQIYKHKLLHQLYKLYQKKTSTRRVVPADI